jgi:hypothetical protein
MYRKTRGHELNEQSKDRLDVLIGEKEFLYVLIR